MTRQLIVNADDFGLSAGVNEGITHAHRHGIVTSTSLMVLQPAAADAARLAAANPDLAVGIHVDLGEWYYDGAQWLERYRVVPTDDPAVVAAELGRQLDAFERLMGRPPTHLDSHQHVHHDANVKPALRAAAERLGVPVRAMSPAIRYEGSFYGQDGRGEPYPDAITADALISVIRSLPDGVTELACHPGFDGELDTTYRDERAREVEALCDPRVRAELTASEVSLRSFATFDATP